MSKNTFKELFPHIRIYSEGELIDNPKNNESAYLSAEELSVYDYVHGLEFFLNRQGDPVKENRSKWIKELMKGLKWLKSHNPEAYLTLDLRQLEKLLEKPLK